VRRVQTLKDARLGRELPKSIQNQGCNDAAKESTSREVLENLRFCSICNNPFPSSICSSTRTTPYHLSLLQKIVNVPSRLQTASCTRKPSTQILELSNADLNLLRLLDLTDAIRERLTSRPRLLAHQDQPKRYQDLPRNPAQTRAARHNSLRIITKSYRFSFVESGE
jgi:hypothetical protein